MADGKYIKYVTIYGLVDMNDNIRYVGVTSRKPNYRLGKNHSEESKNKMSKKKIGKISPRKNCVVSEETRLKQSISKLGKNGNAKGFKHSEETKNKKRKLVLQFDSNGLIINEFNSVSETANYFSVSLSTISKVLNKENKKYKGFIFKTKIKNNG